MSMRVITLSGNTSSPTNPPNTSHLPVEFEVVVVYKGCCSPCVCEGER